MKNKLPKRPPLLWGFLSVVLISSAMLVLEGLFPSQMEKLVASKQALLWLPLTLITHQFMHANFNHLFFNMLIAGPLAVMYEMQVGSKRFLLHWILCGISACLFFMAMPALFMMGGMLGASGACCGIIALGLLNYRGSRTIETLCMMGLIGLFMVNLIPGIIDCLIPSGVAHMAHVGGMLCGMVIYSRKR